jgi:NitT/TauT family transport system substrate-binding protein
MNSNISRVIVLLFLAILAGCSSSSSPEQETDIQDVRVASWSQPITEQSNLLVDEEKGFFKEKGLNMTFIPGAGGGDAIKNILTGKADIAFTDPGSLFFALDKGEKLRVIYSIYPQNVFNVVSLKESNISEPKDLKGKTIGVYSLTSGTRQNLLVLLHQAGLSENDVKIVETGLLNFAPLMQKQVDATAATDTGLFIGKQKGLEEVNVMEVKDYLNFPSDVFVVTEETYQNKKELLSSFLQAYEQSAQWMIENPEEAASLAVEYAIDGADEKQNVEIIRLRNAASQSSVTEEEGLGTIEPELLQQAADMYRKLGLIHNELKMEDFLGQNVIPEN